MNRTDRKTFARFCAANLEQSLLPELTEQSQDRSGVHLF